MALLGFLLSWLLTLLFYVFLGRFFFDLALSLNRNFRPRGLLLIVAESVFTITEVPLKFLRRFIKPIRFGSVQLDFSWTLCVLAIGLLRSLVNSYIF